MGDDSELQLVDLELEDEVIKGVKVIDPPIKGTKNLDHGLPEHQWCPKKEHIIDPDEEKTKVLQIIGDVNFLLKSDPLKKLIT